MSTNIQAPLFDIRTPPANCQYAAGPCDQSFENALRSNAFFLYPSSPEAVALTIEGAVSRLSKVAGGRHWCTWKSLEIPGQIIFCVICKAIRFTKLVVADVTTLNFNVLFEIGYALGLGVPLMPIRDTSNVRDSKDFEELGLFDTLGYFDYANSAALSEGILARENAGPLSLQEPALNLEQPIYIVKGPIESDGMIKLMSVIKKSRLRFRTFDSKEVARISVHDAYKQALSSRAVILHLLSPDTRGAHIHNARCAFIAGLAMASQKHVVMLQREDARQPIDYRDVIRTYSTTAQIPDLVIPVLGAVIEEIQTTRFFPTALNRSSSQISVKLLDKTSDV